MRCEDCKVPKHPDNMCALQLLPFLISKIRRTKSVEIQKKDYKKNVAYLYPVPFLIFE